MHLYYASSRSELECALNARAKTAALTVNLNIPTYNLLKIKKHPQCMQLECFATMDDGELQTENRNRTLSFSYW